jgi:hypothetical protein
LRVIPLAWPYCSSQARQCRKMSPPIRRRFHSSSSRHVRGSTRNSSTGAESLAHDGSVTGGAFGRSADTTGQAIEASASGDVLIEPLGVDMPNDVERELLAMLDEHRRMGAATEPAEPELPDLTPDLFLSVAARNELQAASQLREGAFPMVPQAGSPQDLTSLWAEPFTDDAMAAEIPQAEDNLFMTPDAAAQYEIEFGDIEASGRGPIEDVRFQVGRENPRTRPFYGGRQSGPSDGQVVSRRVGQRFEPVAAPRPQAPRAPVPRPVAQEPAPPPRLARSAYERIMGKGPFDDD